MSSERPAVLDALGEQFQRLGEPPSGSRLARRVALVGSGAIVVAAALAAVLTLGLSASPPRAFAGWSPAPTRASASQVRRAQNWCRSSLPTSNSAALSAPPTRTRTEWKTVLTDVRGPYVVTLYTAASGRTVFSCFTATKPASSVLQGGTTTTAAAVARMKVAPGHIKLVFASSNMTAPDEGSAEFSRLVGRAGLDVTGVSFRLSDGAHVTASTANGWFLAWWPGTARADSAEIATSRGTTTRLGTGAIYGAIPLPKG